MRADFFVSRELEGEKLVAVQVSGRGDTLVVDAGVWDDILSLAGRLKSAPAALAPEAAAVVGPDARKR